MLLLAFAASAMLHAVDLPRVAAVAPLPHATVAPLQAAHLPYQPKRGIPSHGTNCAMGSACPFCAPLPAGTSGVHPHVAGTEHVTCGSDGVQAGDDPSPPRRPPKLARNL